jgi:hypothetical protein
MSCCNSGSTVLPVGAAGTDGSNGTFGGFSGKWLFSTSTSAGPSSTQIRLNNATYSSVTNIYISDTNLDNVSYDAFLDSFSNSGNFGFIRIFKEFDNTKFWIGEISSVTDNGTDHTIGVTYISHSNSFSASDDLVVSFTPSGGSYDFNTNLLYWDASTTLTPGTTEKILVLYDNTGNYTTTTNRIVSIGSSYSGSDDGYFKIVFPYQFTVGAGFTWKIQDPAAADIISLPEGTYSPRTYELYRYYASDTYSIFETAEYQPNTITNYPIQNKRTLAAVYDFATNGGGVGTITLQEKIPSGSLLHLDECTIRCTTALTSGGSALVSVGVGNTITVDTNRPYSSYPYNSTTGFSRTGSYSETTGVGATTTVQRKRARITTAALTTAAGASSTITVTNAMVSASSTVVCKLGTYSGTLFTNGVPYIASVVEGAGSFVIKLANVHATNALSGTVTIDFEVLGEIPTTPTAGASKIRLSSTSNVQVAIAGADLTAGRFIVYIPYTNVS